MKKDSKIEETPQVLEHSVRCRFFAQYWGVRALYVGGVGLEKVGECGWNLKHPQFFLKLKPLSEISDKDAIEWFRIINQKTIESIYKNASGTIVITTKDNFWCIDVQSSNISQIDFLRSKGYLIPFMNYSVQNIVDMGWVQF